MKKFALLLVATLFATSVFAQEWSVGARVGSGFQAVGQYKMSDKNYVEGRFGAAWVDTAVTADFTALYNWNLLEMDWTPSAGIWFVDAGVGVNVGGREHYAYVGAAGMARMGFKFHNVPVSLSIDYTPVIGPAIVYAKGWSAAEFRGRGFANVGLTCTYNF